MLLAGKRGVLRKLEVDYFWLCRGATICRGTASTMLRGTDHVGAKRCILF